MNRKVQKRRKNSKGMKRFIFSKSFRFPKILLIILTISLAILLLTTGNKNKDYLEYPNFLIDVKENKIESIIIDDDELKVEYKDGIVKKTTNPESLTFKEEMLKANIKVKEQDTLGTLSTILSLSVIALALILLISAIKSLTTKQMNLINSGNKRFMPVEKSKTKFSDVAGIEEAKESLMEVVHYMKNPKDIVEMGVKAPSGILLLGDPGNGKTLLAKAVAGEAEVPFFSISGSDFVEKFVGVGASRVRDIFAEARKVSPSIIFIDEIDAVGKARQNNGNGSNDEREQTLNQLLTEMDGLESTTGVVVIAATNRADVLDPALKRAGRFDRHVEVDYPDLEGRKMILKVHAKNKALDETVDLTNVAISTVGFSGADLENVLNQSGYVALRNKRKTISSDDINEGIDEVMIGSKKKRKFLTDKEKKRTAYHEVGHALATYFLANKTIEKISILPSSRALGFVMPTTIDRVSITKKELIGDICISMAGKAAESLIFGNDDVSGGCSQDLKQATSHANSMVFKYGMSELGPISIDSSVLSSISEDIKNQAFGLVQNILKDAYDKTYKYLEDNRKLLEKVTEKVLEKEVLTRKEFNDFLINECGIELTKETIEFMERFDSQNSK